MFGSHYVNQMFGSYYISQMFGSYYVQQIGRGGYKFGADIVCEQCYAPCWGFARIGQVVWLW